jgi:hypothetical protein
MAKNPCHTTGWKRVLLVLQDPDNKKNSRTQEFFRNIHGTVVAWFPTGTIPFGHACGWPDSQTFWKGNSHSWIFKNGNQIRPPTDVHQDCMQRHASLMNTSPVRFILFSANNANTQKILDIDKLRLRRLAYLIGGIGYVQFQKSIAWIVNNKKISLAWSHQGSDRHLDFTTPWRMCMWQSSRKLTPTALPQHATPILSDQLQAQKQQSRLHDLSAHTRPIDAIPDGECPSALPLLLTRLGAYSEDNINTINALIRSTLSITFSLAEEHKTWKVHHLQLIGIPLVGLGTIFAATTSNFHLCDTTCRHLYMIHVNDKLAPSAHQQLLQHVLTREALKRIGQKENNKEDNAIVQKCNEVWSTTLQKRGQQEPTTLHDPLVTLATALYKWGACVCILCATLILADIRQTNADTPTSQNGQSRQQLKRRSPTTATPTTSPVAKAKRQMTKTSSSMQSNPQSPNPTPPTRSDGRQLRSRTSSLSNNPSTSSNPQSPNSPLPTRSNGRQLRSRTSSLSNDPTTNDPVPTNTWFKYAGKN